MTEAQIVAAARSGDRTAIRQLYDRYAPRVFAVVRRIAADEELANDCAQEAWLRAIRALPAFRGDARFSTWLHRIAVNAALEATRKADVRKQHQAGPPPERVVAIPNHGDPLLARRLDAALGQLPTGMREVLILHDVEEYTHEEIARELGITAGTSKSQLFKARVKMREILTREADGGADAAGSEPARADSTSKNGLAVGKTQTRGIGRPGEWTYKGAEA